LDSCVLELKRNRVELHQRVTCSPYDALLEERHCHFHRVRQARRLVCARNDAIGNPGSNRIKPPSSTTPLKKAVLRAVHLRSSGRTCSELNCHTTNPRKSTNFQSSKVASDGGSSRVNRTCSAGTLVAQVKLLWRPHAPQRRQRQRSPV
jgi:hypothetical protein